MSKSSSRKVRERCFKETLKDSLMNVEVCLNHIGELLYEEKNIDEKYIEQDLEKTYYDLEISLSILAITLRKMQENSYIQIPSAIKKDLNSLIHSCKFVFKDHQIYAYSRLGEESIELPAIFDFARSVIGNQ